MSLRINTNLPAMAALRNLDHTSTQMHGAINRLSSGLRINNASDDPAGLIISENMRTQIKGLEQAIRNSQDAVNMAKTAEAALGEVQTLLRNIRGIAVHSANTAVVDVASLQANQTQIRSTIQSINRIAEQTQFGTKKLLDGTAGALANVTSPTNVSSIYMGSTFDGESVVSGPISIAPAVPPTPAQRATVATLQNFATVNSLVPAGAIVINGYSFPSSGADTLTSFVAKINEMSSTTNVSAQITGSAPNLRVTLIQNDFGAQHSIDFFDPGNILHTAASASSTGVDAMFDVSFSTTEGVRTVTFVGGRGAQESGLRLSDTYGNTIMLTEAGNAGIAGPTAIGVLTAGSTRFQIGHASDQSVSFSMPSVFANQLGTTSVPGESIATLDVTTPQGAQDAMRIIDEAVTQLARMRGELGSFQKHFLDSTVRSLDISKENLTASESLIRDADMAVEITEMTRLQVLQQTGMSVLAQANQIPQNVIQLLRG